MCANFPAMSDSVHHPQAGVFSFFSGAGFLDLGFETAGGFQTLFVNEYHKSFLDIYISARRNLGIEPPRFGYQNADITENLTSLNALWLEENVAEARRHHPVIGFIGGPPCPDFSVAGKNRGDKGENGKLSGTYAELICRLKPDFFLFENVKGLYRTQKHRVFFEELKKRFSEAGYSLTEKLINAIAYGAPQDRERIILIGFRKDFLRETGKCEGLTDFDWDAHTSYDPRRVLSLAWPKQETFLEGGKREMPEGIIKELTVQHWFNRNAVTEHPNAGHHFIPRAGLAKFQRIAEGDDLKKSGKRLHRWRYSPTVAYGNNEVHLHPYLPRRISAAEALSLQSLPSNFVIPDRISLTDMFKAIGNGVPYLAARGLARSIGDYLDQLQLPINETRHAEALSG